MFLGRKYEQEVILKAIRSNRAELGIVYGRRRVGKSTLLDHFAAEAHSLYFEGLEKASKSEQIVHFVDQLSRQTQTLPVRATSWKDAFDALSRVIEKGRHYIVFDEFPWMAAERSELVALLKFYWDRFWKKNPEITLILCGSIANFMVKHLVHSRALHNRKTFELKLDPLPAQESKAFFKNFRSSTEIAKFLMIFGGIPKYLEQLDPTKSLSWNLDHHCFMKAGFFVNEFETLFKEQFKVTKNYESIVKTLAKSSKSKEKLAKVIHIDAGGGLKYYLEQLERADFVKAFHPLSFAPGVGQKTKKYVLWDEWLRFYFTYMQPHLQVIQLNQNPGAFDSFAASSIDAYFGLAFERFCFKNVQSIFDKLEIPSFQVLGYAPYFRQGARKPNAKGYRQQGIQIDLLIHRKGGVLTLVECKFSNEPMGKGIISEVERKIEFLDAPKKFTIERVLIATNGVTPQVENEGYFHKILGLDAFL